jgi:hypothetical protein
MAHTPSTELQGRGRHKQAQHDQNHITGEHQQEEALNPRRAPQGAQDGQQSTLPPHQAK